MPNDTSTPTTPTTRQLTVRQLQIIGKAANGQTNEEIGEDLHLTAETIKTHLRKAMRILGARNRVHAITIALTAGMLPATTVQIPGCVTQQHDKFIKAMALQNLGHKVCLCLVSGERIRCEIAAIMAGDAIGIFTLQLGEQRRYRLHEIQNMVRIDAISI